MRNTITAIAAVLCTGFAGAQSLYETRQVGIPEDLNGNPQPSHSLEGYSMFVITPPPPKRLALHDLVTIIVNETSRSSRTQSLETDKEYRAEAQLARFPSLSDLIETSSSPATRTPTTCLISRRATSSRARVSTSGLTD